MNAHERALRDAFLAELWPVCRELSREERDVERALRASELPGENVAENVDRIAS